MKILVVDGNSILNRAFYGIRLLSNKNGIFTNAITGFFNIYLKLLSENTPDAVAVAFDMKAPTFRHKMYDGYKAGRKGMPDELAMQMPYVKLILTAMGIEILETEGWEADDIIGTLSAAAANNGDKCVIATGDRDSFQLINDNVSVSLASNKEPMMCDTAKIAEMYGVSPIQMIEVKALMGDTSDNIPGVAGIGEKTALSLIQKYGTVDNIYSDIDGLEVTASVKNKLINGKDSCYLSRMLGTIALDAPVPTDISAYVPHKRDEQALADILTDLEMFTLLKKLKVTAAAAPVSKAEVSAPVETAKLCDDIITLFSRGNDIFVCSTDGTEKITAERAFELLISDIPKATFNLKAVLSLSESTEIPVINVIFDVTLAAYLLNANASEYTLERLCAEYIIEYSDEDSQLERILSALNAKLYAKLCADGMESLLTEVEIPLASVLSDMEKIGVMLDCDGVRKFGEELLGDIDRISANIYELTGIEFNIASPKQLGEVLFEKLGLPSSKKTKTGYSTNSDVLDFLMDKHPVVPLISEYRTLTKLYSTYVVGLLKAVASDGRLHSTFKQTETRTGRISSAEPNIQNIPVRTKRGREMRRFFAAKEGYVLVDADYSQIELRVLAHISGDTIMQTAFRENEDIHLITASQVFNQPMQWVTPEMRSKAKAVNFGIVYGIGAFSLSKDINVSVAEADKYIKAYLAKYSGVNEYMERITDTAAKQGFVTTMFGRKRQIPELSATNKVVQALGKRMARNTPVQGTAADIIKIAMVRVYERLKKSGLDAKLILQVHDELIVEAREEDAQKVAQLLGEEMENAVRLDVPLLVDVKYGKTWFETH